MDLMEHWNVSNSTDEILSIASIQASIQGENNAHQNGYQLIHSNRKKYKPLLCPCPLLITPMSPPFAILLT